MLKLSRAFAFFLHANEIIGLLIFIIFFIAINHTLISSNIFRIIYKFVIAAQALDTQFNRSV